MPPAAPTNPFVTTTTAPTAPPYSDFETHVPALPTPAPLRQVSTRFFEFTSTTTVRSVSSSSSYDYYRVVTKAPMVRHYLPLGSETTLVAREPLQESASRVTPAVVYAQTVAMSKLTKKPKRTSEAIDITNSIEHIKPTNFSGTETISGKTPRSEFTILTAPTPSIQRRVSTNSSVPELPRKNLRFVEGSKGNSIRVYNRGRPFLKFRSKKKKRQQQDFYTGLGTEQTPTTTTALFEHDIVVFSTENPDPVLRFGYTFNKGGGRKKKRAGRERDRIDEEKLEEMIALVAEDNKAKPTITSPRPTPSTTSKSSPKPPTRRSQSGHRRVFNFGDGRVVYLSGLDRK